MYIKLILYSIKFVTMPSNCDQHFCSCLGSGYYYPKIGEVGIRVWKQVFCRMLVIYSRHHFWKKIYLLD